jgi:hypothetical protein
LRSRLAGIPSGSYRGAMSAFLARYPFLTDPLNIVRKRTVKAVLT